MILGCQQVLFLVSACNFRVSAGVSRVSAIDLRVSAGVFLVSACNFRGDLRVSANFIFQIIPKNQKKLNKIQIGGCPNFKKKVLKNLKKIP